MTAIDRAVEDHGRFIFRAWYKKEKRYIYDALEYELLRLADDGPVPEELRENIPIGFNYNDHKMFIIEQWAGLTDKNGKRIFEGDVVKFGDNPIHDGVLAKCRYHAGRAGFVYEFLTGENKGKCTDMTDDWRSYEKIGNIHDNKELLDAPETS